MDNVFTVFLRSHITIYICTTVNAVLKTICTNCKT